MPRSEPQSGKITGTWDVGPFDNDTPADCCDTLDDAAAGDREGIVRAALTRARGRRPRRVHIRGSHRNGCSRRNAPAAIRPVPLRAEVHDAARSSTMPKA
ncbi:DUF4259 domain-containing protein [Streptomyces sp. NPDC048255]|uniref:DUF4259 domain-containing protein n=1 Tax=Streptomyces sp. NPDC048255 TaxID=3154713 RepID=UPI0033E78608